VGLRKRVIQIVVMAFFLAIYDVVFKPMWEAYLGSGGEVFTIGKSMLGYVIAMSIGFFASWLISRRYE